MLGQVGRWQVWGEVWSEGKCMTICIAQDTLQRRGEVEGEGEGEGCGSEYGAPSYNVCVYTIRVKLGEEEGGHRARNGKSKGGGDREGGKEGGRDGRRERGWEGERMQKLG